MKKRKTASKTAIISFVLLSVAGTILHFAFQFFNGNTLVGAFTPVNESVWEHLKLILVPSIPIGVLEYFVYGKDYEHFLAAKSIGILSGMLFTVLAFYTYSGIIGENYGIVNIAIFFLAAALTSYLTYRLTIFNTLALDERASIIGISIIAVILILFIFFTFDPPQIELFRDPVSEDFGIKDALRYI